MASPRARRLPAAVISDPDADPACRELSHDWSLAAGEDAASGTLADAVYGAPFGESQNLVVFEGGLCECVLPLSAPPLGITKSHFVGHPSSWMPELGQHK
jgi:hypothetical protein